jgi:hypothetical protein
MVQQNPTTVILPEVEMTISDLDSFQSDVIQSVYGHYEL